MPGAEARFVSLAALLNAAPRPPAAPDAEWSCLSPEAPVPPPAVTHQADASPLRMPHEVAAAPPEPTGTLENAARCVCSASQTAQALRAARLFEAALAEAFDAAVDRLTRAMATEILARELRIEAADVAAIARRMLGERRFDEPFRLRVAAADAGIACDLPVIVDARLEPGDALLECAGGTVDARLPVRLAAVLAELAR